MEPVTSTQVPGKGAPGAVCPHFHAAIELIGKRWTGAIVCALTERPMRFGELGKAVPGLSDRLLSQRLRELEEEGWSSARSKPGTPVRVTYSLTADRPGPRPRDPGAAHLGQALENAPADGWRQPNR